MAEEISEARRNTIETGYDHYWRFHKDEKKFAELGCPVCKLKEKEKEIDAIKQRH